MGCLGKACVCPTNMLRKSRTEELTTLVCRELRLTPSLHQHAVSTVQYITQPKAKLSLEFLKLLGGALEMKNHSRARALPYKVTGPKKACCVRLCNFTSIQFRGVLTTSTSTSALCFSGRLSHGIVIHGSLFFFFLQTRMQLCCCLPCKDGDCSNGEIHASYNRATSSERNEAQHARRPMTAPLVALQGITQGG